jgi:hypothetical protein
MRDMFVSTADGLSNAALNDQIRMHTENINKLRAELHNLENGGAVGRSIWNDLFGGENAERETARVKKALDEELAFIKQFQAELAKRNKESGDHMKSTTSDFFDNNGEDEKAKKRLIEGRQAMDQLMKQYYTTSHQYYQAIEMDAQKERDRFKLLLEEKKIDANQYSIAMVLIAKDEATKIEEAYDHTREHSASGNPARKSRCSP